MFRQTLEDAKLFERYKAGFDTIYDEYEDFCREAWKRALWQREPNEPTTQEVKDTGEKYLKRVISLWKSKWDVVFNWQ